MKKKDNNLAPVILTPVHRLTLKVDEGEVVWCDSQIYQQVFHACNALGVIIFPTSFILVFHYQCCQRGLSQSYRPWVRHNLPATMMHRSNKVTASSKVICFQDIITVAFWLAP